MPDKEMVDKIRQFYQQQRCSEFAPSVGIYHMFFQDAEADVKIEDAAIEKYMQQVFRILEVLLEMRKAGFSQEDVDKMLDDMPPYQEEDSGMNVREQKIMRSSLNQFSNGGLYDSAAIRDSVSEIGKLMKYDVDSFSWRMLRKSRIHALIIGMSRRLDVLEEDYFAFAVLFLNALFIMTAKDTFIEREYAHGGED